MPCMAATDLHASVPCYSNNQPRAAIPYLYIIGCLTLTRLLVWSHPNPTHPDEAIFVAAFGFPADYPVHAPGYPLWVAAGTTMTWLGLADYNALKFWSLIASILGPCLLIRLGQYWLERRTALLTALLFGMLPVTWFHSVTASTYLAASCFGIAIAWLIWSSVQRRSIPRFWLATVLLSVCLFLRTDVLLYLGPLLLYGAYLHRRIGTALALLIPPLALGCFYLITIQLYTDAEPDAFARRSAHARDVVLGTSVFELGIVDGLLRNAVKVIVNLAWNFGGVVLGLLFARAARRLSHSLYDRGNADAPMLTTELQQTRTIFLFVWIMPGLAFLLLMHCVQGYFLWVFPALCLAIVTSAVRWSSHHITRFALYLALALNVLLFTMYPWSADTTGIKRTIDAKIGYLSLQGLKHIDRRGAIHLQGDTWKTGAHDR